MIEADAYFFDIDGTLMVTRNLAHWNGLHQAMLEIYEVGTTIEGLPVAPLFYKNRFRMLAKPRAAAAQLGVLALQPPECLSDWILHDGIHQADPQSLRSCDLLGGNKQFQGSSFANQTRQALRSSPTRDQSESGSAMPKDCMGRRDSIMTGQCQIQTAPHAITRNRSINRSREPVDRVHQGLPRFRELVCGWAIQRRYLDEFRSRR